ncbi:MAG: hypothetical protein A2X99_03120 [Deltaproteobacteria bacterium GWB2_55_19]|nr:MAG: hypothetical protein A2X99_03120 [Deltaproteobacteria bacterium GWB2_55_19]HAO94367.1 hypothetical protein [Deltaproteobacteria bacterium]
MRFGIRTKLLVFATLVWAVIFGVYSFYIYHERIEQTRRMALMAADLLSRKIAADRQYYASTVVKRALEAGLTVTGAYQNDPKAIPLPTTFIKEVSKSLGSRGGLHMEIVSLYPINPANAPRDAFQQEALEIFATGAEARHYSFEDFEGMASVRYMIPDIATSQTCVDCHNNNPGSPRTDYKIGDVAGALEVVVPIESEMHAAMDDILRSILYGFAVVLSMGLVGLAFIRKVVTSPVLSLVDTTRQLASGDLTAGAGVKSKDELGLLAAQTNELARNLSVVIEGIRKTSDEETEITSGLKDVRRRIIDGATRQGAAIDSIGGNMEGLNATIVEIARYSESLAAAVEKGAASVLELGASVADVVDNMDSLLSSVDETAASTRDMSFSIKEISENIESLSSSVMQVSSSMTQINARIREVETNAAEASRFAEDVIRDANAGLLAVESTIDGIIRTKDITRESTGIINSLSEKIKEIGKTLDVIRDVAEETNLLALNAAIIAAQSGEHGKSFSVVSNEIKDLAERTSTSAKEVSEIIDAVEIESNRAVKAMDKGCLSAEEGVKLSMEAGEGLKKIVSSAKKSTESVREIARASVEQSKEINLVVEATGKVAEMTRRIVSATQEQAKGSELITRASERLANIAYRVKGSTRAQAASDKEITGAIEEVRSMVSFISNIIREQEKNTAKVVDAIEAVRMVSVENRDKVLESEKAFGRLIQLNRDMSESVARFRLDK